MRERAATLGLASEPVFEQTPNVSAVAAIRVSTTKQGTEGDSPEAQQEQIKRWAATHGVTIKQTFVFLESASKEEQPLQHAIDYCENPKNDIQLFVIKSIDRFTRGGSYMYDHLKMQLERYGVKLVDIYGVISSQKVNTLEHLGFQYSWSVYSPTQKAEILEAERAKDEIRDIMSRMVGAEIRYTQMGYWMRRPPYGLISEKIETPNGKRTVLLPHPQEGKLMRKLFELRATGLYDDKDIAEQLNQLGFKSRTFLLRDKHDRTKIVGERGGKPILAKDVAEYVCNPIYAGVICEKWTNYKPVRGKFKGLVSMELFNKANKGKWTLVEATGEIQLLKRQPTERYLNKKGTKSAEFAYRKVIICPGCERPLLGSASRGKLGKYYPAYHCNKRGHYFRVPKQEFEDTIREFVQNVQFTPEYIEAVTQAVIQEWDRRQVEEQGKQVDYDSRIAELQRQAAATVGKIKVLSSEVAIKFMEEELVKIDTQISGLEAEKQKTAGHQSFDIRTIMGNIRHYMEHLDELLLEQLNGVAKAEYFGLLFDKTPTYSDIKYGTQNPTALTGMNELFRLKNFDNTSMVTPGGFEPPLTD